jgi:biopolymer transport protein ExbD
VKFARRARQEVDINLTPLIDVVFLLLIFFMVSTTFTKETHLSIDLPEASSQSSRSSDLQIEITITRDGDYAINGVSLINRQDETLREAIQKVSEGDNAIPMIITADSATPHQSVVTALDIAGQLGFTQLSITTKLATDSD